MILLQRKTEYLYNSCKNYAWWLSLFLLCGNHTYSQSQVPYYIQHRDWGQIKIENWTNLDKEIGKKFLPFLSNGLTNPPTRDYPYTYSGRAVSHAFSSSGIFYVGFSSGALWRLNTYTGQDSLSWKLVTDNCLLSQSIGAVTVDPLNEQYIIIGTGSHENGEGRGVYYTQDGGNTWVQSSLPQGSQAPTYCYAFAWYNQSLYVATSNGLLQSSDKGRTWNSVTIPNANGSVTDVIKFSSQNSLVAAVSNNGLYRLNTNGQWTKIPNSPNGSMIDIECNNKVIYALVGASLYSGNTNSFSSPINNNAPDGFNTLKVSSDDSVIYVGSGGGGIYKSTDRGKNFNPISDYYTVHVDQRGFAMNPKNKRIIYAICDGGVYRSQDAGTTWYNLNIGLQTFQCTDMESYPGSIQRIYVGQQDNGSQSCVNGLWTIGGAGDGGSNHFKLNDSLIAYEIRGAVLADKFNSQGRGIPGGYTSFDAGINPTPGQPWTYLNSLAINPKNSNTQYLSTDNGLYKTTNGGSSPPNTGWQIVQTAKNPRWAAYVNFVAVDYLDTAIVYYLNQTGSSFLVYRSGNSGINGWNSFALTGSDYFSIVSSQNKVGRSFVVGGNTEGAKICISNNFSDPYTDLPGLLPPMQVFYLIETPKLSTGIIQRFIGNQMGVYWSFGHAGKWFKINNNLPNLQVRKVEFHDLTKSLRVATYGRGVWQLPCPIFATTNISLNSLSEKIYTSKESINVNDNVSIASNTEVTLIAQKGISFGKGFSVSKGATLSVFTFKEIE